MADIALSLLTKILEYLVEPILIRPLRPVFCFKSMVDDFNKEHEKLSVEEMRVKDAVKEAKDNGREVYEHVEKWVEDAKRVMEEAQKLQSELTDDKSCCFSSGWTCHYGLSKQVLENTNSTKELCERAVLLNQVAHPVDLRQHTVLPSSEDFMISKSADLAFRAIMEGMVKDDVRMIGLYGMGGIGKTTLAEQVRKEAERLKIFDRTIMVTISQNPEIRRIQGVIADFLNLKLQQETEEGRASQLNQRLKSEKMLVVLDDVWKEFDLSKIGMFGAEGNVCKILLTTRRLHVCTSMDCQTNVSLNLLSEDEAWDLFKKKSDLPDGSELTQVAKQIVGECKGLPIALATVGSALRKKSERDWIQALKKLRDARLLDIPEVGDNEKNAYKCLRLSYDYLKHSATAQAQILLLICSLYPEDHEIDVEDLTRCAFGMRLFERVESVQDAREELWVTVQCLVNSGLLLPGTNEKEFVKMHDVVRDVALWIGGTEDPERSVFTVRDGRDMSYLVEKESFRNCRAISFMPSSMSELSNYELVCPKVETMLVFGGEEDVKLPDAFFKHMEALKVLDVRGHDSLMKCKFSIPQSLQHSTDVRSISFRFCDCSNYSVVGELRNLEILSNIHSQIDCEIEAILRETKKLRLLDLRGFGLNQKIPSNVIKDLLKLEELYTVGGCSFEGETGNGCCLSELNSLHKLVRFSAHLESGRCFPPEFCFPDLEYYAIAVGFQLSRATFWYGQADAFAAPLMRRQKRQYGKVLGINGIEGRSRFNAFRKLFPTVEYLDLMYPLGTKTIIEYSQEQNDNSPFCGLKELKVGRNEELETVFEFEGNHSKDAGQQQWLQVLKLYELPNLKQIWNGSTGLVTLRSLTQLKIRKCAKLISVFSSALCIAPSLQQLEFLSVRECDDLQEIVSVGVHDGDFSSCFQNLRKLHVKQCGTLKAIFSIVPSLCLQLPKLQEVIVYGNPELEHLFSLPEAEQWPSLQMLEVWGCPKLSQHFVANILTHLQAQSASKQLRHIQLGDMKGVEKIMQLQRGDENEQMSMTSHLEKLWVVNLQDLKCLWSGTKEVTCSFSYLTGLHVIDCNNMKQLLSATIAQSLMQLKDLHVIRCNGMKQIITIDDQIEEENSIDDQAEQRNDFVITFPKLKRLNLWDLPNLIRFCPASYRIEIPCLETHGPLNCPKLITNFLL